METQVTISFPRVIRNNHSAYSEGMRATHVSLRDTRHIALTHIEARSAIGFSRTIFPILFTERPRPDAREMTILRRQEIVMYYGSFYMPYVPS